MKKNNKPTIRSRTKSGLVEGYTPSQRLLAKRKDDGFTPQTKASEQRVRSAVQLAESLSKERATRRGPSTAFNEATGTYDNLVSGEHGELILKVRKGKRESFPRFCADCKSYEPLYWRYQDSNYGTVYLCNTCKVAAFERSYGHADAMPLKVDHAHARKGEW